MTQKGQMCVQGKSEAEPRLKLGLALSNLLKKSLMAVY